MAEINEMVETAVAQLGQTGMAWMKACGDFHRINAHCDRLAEALAAATAAQEEARRKAAHCAQAVEYRLWAHASNITDDNTALAFMDAATRNLGIKGFAQGEKENA